MSPRIISHRAKIDLSSPENDLRGIQEAIDLGVGMVEFDVRKTSDEILVCHHDAKVHGVSVSNLTYESLKNYNEHSCKLEEVLSLCKGKVGVNLEIKEEGFKVAIVPIGSGNGIARHFNIPLDISKALDLILKQNYTKVDIGRVNEFLL